MEIISNAAENGYAVVNTREKLFELCGTEEIQKAWSNWQELSDREEIRLRLQAIYNSGLFHTSLTPFILFFFRASDPVTYQIAARIVGKWVHSNRELQNYIHQYLSVKKVDLSEPIFLNGQRSLRRLLIVLSEHAAHHGESLTLAEEVKKIALPVQTGQFSNSLPSSQFDRSVYMLSTSLLSETYQDKLLGIARELLKLPTETSFELQSWDRNIIRNWGILLSKAPVSKSEKKSLWFNYLQKEASHFNEFVTFSEQLQALFRIDEIIRSSVFSLTGIQHKEINFPDVELSHFCQLRLNHWMNREKGHLLIPPVTDSIPNMQRSTFVFRHYLSKDKTQFQKPESQLSDLLLPLINDYSWRVMPVSDRAYNAFFLLDTSTHCQAIPTEELLQLLSTISNSLPLENNRTAKTAIALPVILKKLISTEQTAKANIPDGKLIHKITDESLLLDLLPTAIDTGQLAILADAFENQIRLLITTDPAFNLDHFLYKISIREPNLKFYRYLKELSLERKYIAVNSQNSHFSEKIDLIYQHSAHEPSPDLPEPLKFIRFWLALHQIRKRLSGYSEEQNLFDLLQLFVHELDGTGTDTVIPKATLHDLVNIVQADEQEWLKSGFPSRVSGGRAKSNQQLADLRSQLASNCTHLIPADFSGVSDVSETVQRIKHLTNQVAMVLNPLLSGSDGVLLNQLIGHIHELLSDWNMVLAKTSSRIAEAKTEYLSEGNRMWQTVFEVAVAQPNKAFQSELLKLFLNNILGTENSSVQKNWYRRYQVLTWACLPTTTGKLEPDIRQFWETTLRNHWITMLQSAIDEKQEARVLQLVRSDELAVLRRSDQVKPWISFVKTWCFERYDLNNATVCNQELNPDSNYLHIRVATLKEYFSYFSNVWIALIVGVIMMFDFGTPWADLAEMGDFGGVIFTFILGVGGTYLYVIADLRKKVTFVKSDPFQWVSQFGRVGFFLTITLVFTVLMVLLFWYMFSSTDQVVHGSNAIWHIMSWTGFALFVGVFFGLIGKG